MAPRIKLIVILNLLWSEFVETNERRFDQLRQILISRSVVADRNVAHPFRQTRSKVSLKLLSMLKCFGSNEPLVATTTGRKQHGHARSLHTDGKSEISPDDAIPSFSGPRFARRCARSPRARPRATRSGDSHAFPSPACCGSSSI